MSSFAAHALAALTIGKLFQKKDDFKQNFFWQICLVGCAFAPDIDYLVDSLNAPNNDGLRITHTILYTLLLPLVLMPILFLLKQNHIFLKGLQAWLAGLSHLILDLLVGSKNGDPLFYPLSERGIVLPFGILPSAGAIKFSNYYFYRNLLIELGILIPVFIALLFLFNRLRPNKLTMALLACIFVTFLIFSINLKR